ncbi:MAG: GGDEF domain-containing protein [Zoogloeaceae bacterium]|nr:GGDEF domain-containing protein [Zoogloeaceae bacterium]
MILTEHPPQPPWKIHLAVVAGLFVVGYIDYVTGTELRVFPLYFLPLMGSAWHLNRRTTVFFALLADSIWIFSLYAAGREYSHPLIWPANFVTQGSAFVMVGVMVGNLRKSLLRERALSRTDGLTQLPNRRGFEIKAELAVALCHRYRHPIALAYLDLDNFKRANDQRGHAHGDTLLQGVARLLRERLRVTDIPARLGGDEFVILLPETPLAGAQHLLENLRAALAAEPAFEESGVTASIGAVAYPTPPANLAELLAAADQAMYEVKDSTKNRLHLVEMPALPATQDRGQ